MNNRPESSVDPGQDIEDEAIAWFVRMRGEVNAKCAADFEAWCSASSAHQRAYTWAETHFANAGMVGPLADTGASAWRRSPFKWLAAGTAIAAMIVAAMGISLHQAPPHSSPQLARRSSTEALVTTAREIRTWQLTDGSRVTLDAGSRVEVAMTGVERRLRLRRGKARFSVARDERPFIVEAASGMVTAQAAVFDVGFDRPGRVTASLISGKAEMQGLMQPAVYTVPVKHALTATPITYPTATFEPVEDTDSVADTRDWPSGWVQYRAIALRDLVSEANRYASQPIVVDDPAIGDMQASGRFKLTDTDGFVTRIAEVFDLSAKPRADGIHLARR